MGAAKAGITIVTHNEKDDCDALHHVLKDSGAKGLFFSSASKVNEEGDRRETFV